MDDGMFCTRVLKELDSFCQPGLCISEKKNIFLWLKDEVFKRSMALAKPW